MTPRRSNAANRIGVSGASVPPTIARSIKPKRICIQARPIASVDDVQALEMHMAGPRIPNVIASWVATTPGYESAGNSGCTLRMPLSRKTAWFSARYSAVPTEVPMKTPIRVVSEALIDNLASSTAIRADARPNCTQRALPEISRCERKSFGRKSRTCPATRVPYGDGSNASSAVIPDRPLTRFSHIRSTPGPYGVTAPIPVTTTRRKRPPPTTFTNPFPAPSPGPVVVIALYLRDYSFVAPKP